MIDVNINTYEKLIRVFVWIFFLLFFVYANLVKTMFYETSDITEEYMKIQNSFVTMFVNFGLLFMIIIENIQKHKESSSIILMLATFFIIAAMYAHAYCYYNSDPSKPYIFLLRKALPSYLLNGVFIGMLFYLKYKTVKNDYKIVNI